MLPLAGFAGAALVLALALHGSRSQVERLIPSRRRPGGGGELVPFTRRLVHWRKNPKTGEDESRQEVVELPAELAQAATAKAKRSKVIPLTTFTLATVLASEAGGLHPLAKVAIAHAVKNMARKRGISVFKLIAPDGRYGSQQGRHASSKRAPSLADLEIAEAVEAGKLADPSDGAIQWDSPDAQRALLARGEPGYQKTPETVAEERRAKGRRLVILPGLAENQFRMWA